MKNCDTTKQSVCRRLYTLPSQDLSTRAKALTAGTRVMRSSSNELSSLVSDSAKCKQTEANPKPVIIPKPTWIAEIAER